ncbi:MAG TPA: rod shape-determining protein RodA [Capsulimonadaceae bacterium]|jgi:rod shape determining protein RodA
MVQFSGTSRDKYKVDLPLLVTVLVIALGGVLSIRSALHGDVAGAWFVKKQLIGILAGTGLLFAIALTDYSAFLPRISKPLTFINIGLLILVLKLGHSAKGAQRWIPLGPVQFQPSEVAKLAIIIALAVYLSRRRGAITDPRTIAESFGVIVAPFALIFLQPDLGTGLVIVTLWLGMLFIGGAKLRHLAVIVAAGLAVFGCLWVSGKIKDYQKQRLTSFINPKADPRDTGYHLRQSQIAIGAGQFLGQGYGHGLQAGGNFIPEQHTDFIFTVVGEEGGFVGAIALLALYLFALQRCIWIMLGTQDYFGRLLIAGVVSMLAFHVIVNIGMTIGVMPVTGVPLPFFSYGLSSLVIDMAAIGIVLSVNRRSSSGIIF